MGTRSAIGYQLPSGRIKAVYCHWDGHPKHHLPILIGHYNTLDKAKALIKPGSMSSLRTRETWDSELPASATKDFNYVRDDEGFLMYDNDREPQPLYHHERGDGPWNATDGDYADPPNVNASITAAIKWWRDSFCEHMYIFEPDIGWLHYDLGKPLPTEKLQFKKLNELLSSVL